MDQEQELTIGEAYTAGYLFGRKEFARDLELLQVAELEGEYQAMLAENKGRKVYVLEALDWRCNDGMPKVEL